jgi:hypothetical protein
LHQSLSERLVTIVLCQRCLSPRILYLLYGSLSLSLTGVLASFLHTHHHHPLLPFYLHTHLFQRLNSSIPPALTLFLSLAQVTASFSDPSPHPPSFAHSSSLTLIHPHSPSLTLNLSSHYFNLVIPSNLIAPDLARYPDDICLHGLPTSATTITTAAFCTVTQRTCRLSTLLTTEAFSRSVSTSKFSPARPSLTTACVLAYLHTTRVDSIVDDPVWWPEQ